MRLGIPVTEKLVSQYYRKTTEIFLFDIDPDGKRVTDEWVLINNGSALSPASLKNLGVTDMIIGQIDPPVQQEFIDNDIRLFTGVEPVSPHALLTRYLKNDLVVREV